jgi:hypothetical protein
MHSYQHSRGRILFEVACAFGMSASCAWAWQQTYATAMLPAAGIAALFGLVRALDMLRAAPTAVETVEVPAPAAIQSDPALVIAAPEPAEAVAEAAPKRKRKASRKSEDGSEKRESRLEPEPVVSAEPESQPTVVEAVAEPEAVEPQSELRIVENVADEPQYIPATPLFEAEPFVRQQRAAFGRKAR